MSRDSVHGFALPTMWWHLSGILQEYCVKTVTPATPALQVPLSLGDDFAAIVLLNRVMPNFRISQSFQKLARL